MVDRVRVDLRPAADVMRLSQLGASHQTRLSFMRVLLRGLRRGGWQVQRTVWDMDAAGTGRAVYQVATEGQCYSLVAFAHDLPADQRSDRVIAEAWDATFALFDGVPSRADLDRLAANVPLQEAGRVTDRELVLSRANRSVRLWDHVVDHLAKGQQPDATMLAEVGYLMRTTAVYGSGKFGAADHSALKGRALMDGPFRAEMLAVWLIRTFVADLVEHMAKARGGSRAVVLAPHLRRGLGIGNSTGLGMAPFLVNHPVLLNNWITAKETALARVRGLPQATPKTRASFAAALSGFETVLATWRSASAHPLQQAKLAALDGDVAALRARVQAVPLEGPTPWDALWRWAEATLSEEGLGLCLSLILEPHGDLVDDLADHMGADERASARIDGAMTLTAVRELIDTNFDWALAVDFSDPQADARFWYVSEAKLEPRLGDRRAEPGAELEQPLDVARAVQVLWTALQEADPTDTVAQFLQLHPQHRRAMRRVQIAARHPYSEIRDNLISAQMSPLDMLRCKLACFGATRFDPRSDRWLRITMFQNAPYPQDLHDMAEDAWALPSVPEPA